jgi:hypothetical protein
VRGDERGKTKREREMRAIPKQNKHYYHLCPGKRA